MNRFVDHAHQDPEDMDESVLTVGPRAVSRMHRHGRHLTTTVPGSCVSKRGGIAFNSMHSVELFRNCVAVFGGGALFPRHVYS